MARLVKLFRMFKQQRGFLFVEGLISLGILGFIGVIFLLALSSSAKTTGILDEQTTAESLARAQLEDIRDMAYDTGGYSVTVDTSTMQDYTVSIAVTEISTGKQEVVVTVSRESGSVFSVVYYKVDR